MAPSATTNGDVQNIRTVSLSYDTAQSEDSARKLIFALYPEWETSEGDLEFVRFKDGITNTARPIDEC